MKENEFRIGNYFSWNGKYYMVNNLVNNGYWTLNSSTIEQERYDTINFSEVKPIYLDEEILLKCGFVIKDADSFSYLLKFDRLPNDISLLINACFYLSGEFMTITLSDYDTKIQYLHQLQNLYFAVTNEELKIEL